MLKGSHDRNNVSIIGCNIQVPSLCQQKLRLSPAIQPAKSPFRLEKHCKMQFGKGMEKLHGCCMIMMLYSRQPGGKKSDK